jgi:hypothetical protein
MWGKFNPLEPAGKSLLDGSITIYRLIFFRCWINGLTNLCIDSSSLCWTGLTVLLCCAGGRGLPLAVWAEGTDGGVMSDPHHRAQGR